MEWFIVVSHPASTETFDTRLCLRLPKSLNERLSAEFAPVSEGIRVGMEHAVACAPYQQWPYVGPADDLDGATSVRQTVRVQQGVLRAVETAVDGRSVSRSRAIRDGVREVLRG